MILHYKNNLVCPSLVSFHLPQIECAKVKPLELKTQIKTCESPEFSGKQKSANELRDTVQVGKWCDHEDMRCHTWLLDPVGKEPPDEPWHVCPFHFGGSIWKWVK